MKIATSELKHLREEVKNCHRIINDLQKKREFVGLTYEEVQEIHDTYHKRMGPQEFASMIEAKLRSKNEH